MVRGQIVKSLAGHDAGSFYVVVKSEEDVVWIADGKLRKLEKPKRKNPKHVGKTNTVLDLAELDTDKKLRNYLKEHFHSSDLSKKTCYTTKEV